MARLNLPGLKDPAALVQPMRVLEEALRDAEASEATASRAAVQETVLSASAVPRRGRSVAHDLNAARAAAAAED